MQLGSAAAASLLLPTPVVAEPEVLGSSPSTNNNVNPNTADEDLREIFLSFSSNKKQQPTLIEWSPPSQDFSQELRYGTSSLGGKEEIVPRRIRSNLPYLPSWMEGHWLCTYKFEGTSFPQGRDKLSLRVPGAGLGTCAALPNVGFNPAPFVQRFVSTSTSTASSKNEAVVVEDVAYNLPRKLEGFWPQAKVNSVRISTEAFAIGSTNTNTNMSPLCLVTGEGCGIDENPELHGQHATRCRMEFEGPTRTGGFRTQHLDLSMVDWLATSTTTDTKAPVDVDMNVDRTTRQRNTDDEDEFIMSRTFVQNNVEQELTSYYREFVSFDRQQQKQAQQQQQQQSWMPSMLTAQSNLPSTGLLRGRTRVAVFLPGSSQAVALYSYTMKLYSITEEEAMMY